MRTKKIRFVFMILAGIVITYLLDSTMMGEVHQHERIFDFLITIVITVLAWEGNL